MLSSIEVATLTGASYRELDYWIRRGVLVCERPAAGSGSQRGWSEAECRIVLVVLRLRHAGVRLDALARMAREMRAWAESEWGGVVFVDEDGGVWRNPRSMCHYIDLDDLLDIDEKATA